MSTGILNYFIKKKWDASFQYLLNKMSQLSVNNNKMEGPLNSKDVYDFFSFKKQAHYIMFNPLANTTNGNVYLSNLENIFFYS
jgi:hypothetical protein